MIYNIMGAKRILPEDFFKSRVQKTEGCWIWTGAKTVAGYGVLSTYPDDKPKRTYAHRFSYELYKGKISNGMLMCHTCDNPSCVNPEHLFEGGKRENAIDMVKKGRSGMQKRTHCKRGHSLTPDNLYLRASPNCLVCKTCFQASNNEKARRHRERKILRIGH